MILKKRVNIVIPLGGAGKRFSDAGYKESKPFIDVDGKSMIKTVVDNLYDSQVHYIFIVNEEYTSIEEFRNHIADLDIQSSVYSTMKLTDGPASTALLAISEINSNTPLIIINCDQVIVDLNLDNLEKFVEVNECDGLLGCFISSSPKNSYVKLDESGKVCDVKEKVVISNIATNGLHYWKTGSMFVSSAIQMIKANDRYNNEFYVAPTYNYLIKEEKKILPFFYNMHFPIGTPEDLETYLEKKWKYLK